MITRAKSKLFNSGKGATGYEDPWRSDSDDILPCDPSNSLAGRSSAWRETDQSLKIIDPPVSDTYFTVSGSDLILNGLEATEAALFSTDGLALLDTALADLLATS